MPPAPFRKALAVFWLSLFLAVPPAVDALAAAPGGGSASSDIGAGEPQPKAPARPAPPVHRGKGRLGVMIQDVTPDLAAALGLDRARGVLVAQVDSGGPAQQAGIMHGDVVLSFQGREVNQSKELAGRVASAGAGARVSLVVFRKGREKTFSLTLGAAPEAAASPWDFQAALGLTLKDLAPDRAEALKLKSGSGVLVRRVDVEGLAFKSGLREGDVIREVGRKPCGGLAGFRSHMAGVKPGDKVLLLVQRWGSTVFIVLKTR